MRIPLHVLEANVVIDAIDTPFEVTPKAFDCVSMAHTIDVFLCAVVDGEVLEIPLYPFEGLCCIAHYNRSRLNVLFNQELYYIGLNA